MRYGPETRDEVRRSCAGLSGPDLTQKVHEWAHTLEIHASTVYRWLGSSKLRRARRADKGRRRVEVAEEDLTRMIALTVRYGMTAEDVIEHAEANGWIGTGQLSPATYNRILRERHVSLSKLTTPGRLDGGLVKTRLKNVAYRRWQAPFANYLHQLDLTELPRYFVEADGSIGFESPLTFGRNKRGNSRPRLNLFALVDDYSRVTYARFYYGKNTLNWIDFCMRAWDAKPDAAGFPFCGRPSVLFSDNDSAPKSGMFTQFLRDMDVEFKPHLVGNPRAKGKVERTIGTLKEKMTSLLRVHVDQGKRVMLKEANEILHDLLYKLAYKAHGTTGEQPMLRWSSGLQGPARMMPSPEVRERYFYDSVQSLVRGDLTIRLGGVLWQLPRREPFLSVVGEKVLVYFHRGERELSRIIVMVDDLEYAVDTQMEMPDVAGNIKALPKSQTEMLLEAVYDEDLSEFQAGKAYRERYKRLMFPAAQEAFDESKVTGPRKTLSRVALKLRLRQDGIRFTAEAIDELYQAHEGDVPESEYEQIAARFRAAG